MQLSSQQIQSLSSLAIKAAISAGKYISEKSKDQLSIQSKNAGTSLASQVLTEVDLASEGIILDILTPSLKQYDLALLSEETTDDQLRFTKDYFWCIDPLDGTLPFTEQRDGYSVSIALVHNDGTPITGVIYDPITNTIYNAIKDGGAYKNHQKWKPSSPHDKPLTLISDRSATKQHDYNKTITKLAQITKSDINTISHGGAAMNAMWVIENSPAIYYKQPKTEKGGGSIWDFAASACIYNELGAIARNFNGEKLDLNRKDSTFMNHEGILFCSTKRLISRVRSLL